VLISPDVDSGDFYELALEFLYFQTQVPRWEPEPETAESIAASACETAANAAIAPNSN